MILMVPIKIHRTDQKSFKIYILHNFFPKKDKTCMEETALALVFAQLLSHVVVEVASYCYHSPNWAQIEADLSVSDMGGSGFGFYYRVAQKRRSRGLY